MSERTSKRSWPLCLTSSDAFLHIKGDESREVQRLIHVNKADASCSHIFQLIPPITLEDDEVTDGLRLHKIVMLPLQFPTISDDLCSFLSAFLHTPIIDNGIKRIAFLAPSWGRIVAGRVSGIVQIHFTDGDCFEMCRDRSGMQLSLWYYSRRPQ